MILLREQGERFLHSNEQLITSEFSSLVQELDRFRNHFITLSGRLIKHIPAPGCTCSKLHIFLSFPLPVLASLLHQAFPQVGCLSSPILSMCGVRPGPLISPLLLILFLTSLTRTPRCCCCCCFGCLGVGVSMAIYTLTFRLFFFSFPRNPIHRLGYVRLHRSTQPLSTAEPTSWEELGPCVFQPEETGGIFLPTQERFVINTPQSIM